MLARAGVQAAKRIRVRGQVQGVGFRPFIYRLAAELGLSGWVRNDAGGVEIEAQDLGRLDAVSATPAPVLPGRLDVAILASRPGHAHTGITPDAATCPDCLAELFDPADRRYRYPFTNCTHCGPRYSITRHLPYDRPNTSMAGFALCPACQNEYDDPRDRRFHAQPNACPVCGPRLALLEADGRPALANDAIAATLERLRAGQIVAIKGLGGFHLMCDARNGEAVARLRSTKQREEKPFAVMLAGTASLAPYALCGEAERRLLEARERPIVLLQKQAECDAALPNVAPGMAELGVLLPYAPLHYLLFHETAGRPDGTAWLAAPQALALVCTSANPGGEPLVAGNGEALRRLSGIADAFLVHDRDILVRCDDSVVRVLDAAPSFIRRARGHTPRAIRLAQAGRPVLTVGGWFKNTVCLTRGDEAFLSQHIGDLDNAATCRFLEDTAQHLMDVLEIEPELVAHDLHPDFFSTRFAVDFARQRGIPAIAVQHHHAHIAAVLAEHGLTGPALGLALPGGDRAAREPWRMAASALHALGRDEEIGQRFPSSVAGMVRQMLEKSFNSPATSSCGRLFDAAAGLLGVREVAAFEGQAAMLLEGLAGRHGPVAPLAGGFRLEADGSLNLLPLLAALADIGDAGQGAALFHATLAKALAAWVAAALEETGLSDIALGGGCRSEERRVG